MQRRNLKLCCNATLIAIRARYDRAPAGHSAVDFHISGRCTDGIYYRLRRIVVIYIGIHELDYSRVITPLLAELQTGKFSLNHGYYQVEHCTTLAVANTWYQG